MRINFRSLIAGALLILVFVAAVLFLKSQRRARVVLPPAAPEAVSYHSSLKTQGPDIATVKLVEYSDFGCPSCRVMKTWLHDFVRNYPGQIQVIYKHYPLTSHPWSVYAHQAAECMNIQGKFWVYHDVLYDKQAEWAPSNVPPVEILARYANELGANMEQFGKCMADVAVARAVYAEKAEGNGRQVNATPTVFLGEERFVGPKEMQERGENAIRKILGLPPKPPTEKKPEPLVPAPLKGAGQ